MAHETITLPLQDLTCEGCLWHNNAQGALNSLIRNGESIVSAEIVCVPKNKVHALMEARAYEVDAKSHEYHVLVCQADVYCQRREIDPTFIPIDEID